MCLKHAEKKKLLERLNKVAKWLQRPPPPPKLGNIHRKIPVLESLFNSEYCEIFRSTYFEEHLVLKVCS